MDIDEYEDQKTSVKVALLTRIRELAPRVANDSQAQTVLMLAEAFAYVAVPNVPHGGGTKKA